jgi:hypothetical protein
MKFMARNGKIARLPREIREELNRRLQDNEPGGSLLAWLNALPGAQAVLAREFGGCAISKQNLCEWRAGGFVEWQTRQEALAAARELAADATELETATEGRLTDHLATVLAARYASVLAGWNGEATDDFRRKLRALRGLCQDIVELRRGDHSGARLKMEQERLEREREKTEEEVIAHFQRWLRNPEVRDLVCQNYISPEEREARSREIFGRPPKQPKTWEEALADENEEKQRQIREIYGLPPEESPAAPESNPVKLNPTKSNQMKTRLNRAANHGRVTPHGGKPAHRVASLQKMMANDLPSKMKDKLCIYYSHRFWAAHSILAAAGSASFS